MIRYAIALKLSTGEYVYLTEIGIDYIKISSNIDYAILFPTKGRAEATYCHCVNLGGIFELKGIPVFVKVTR